MIGDGVVVNLRHRAFLAAQHASEVAEVVYRQRNVGIHSLADRLAVVPGLGAGQKIKVRFHHVGDLQQDVRPVRGTGLAPGVFRGMGGIQRQRHVGLVGPGDFADHPTRDGRDVVHIAARNRGHEFPADIIVIAGLEWRGELASPLGHVVHLGLLHDPTLPVRPWSDHAPKGGDRSAGVGQGARATCLRTETHQQRIQARSSIPNRFIRR